MTKVLPVRLKSEARQIPFLRARSGLPCNMHDFLLRLSQCMHSLAASKCARDRRSGALPRSMKIRVDLLCSWKENTASL
jgi:hypothetical protein